MSVDICPVDVFDCGQANGTFIYLRLFGLDKFFPTNYQFTNTLTCFVVEIGGIRQETN